MDPGPERGGGRLSDVLGEKPVPFHGYYFKLLSMGWDGSGAVVLNGGKNHHPHMFGICAYPAEYGKTGRRTFVITEMMMDPLWKDLGGKPIDAFPADPAKDRWEWAGPRR